MKKLLKKIWNNIDENKTISGIAISATGAWMFLSPVTATFASGVLITGISTTVGGLIHKVYKIKYERKQNESKF